MSGKHAKLAPSASSRWLNCPGSIALEAKCPEPPESEYAEEGTAAHELAEKCLNDWRLAMDYYGNVFNGYEVDDEMADAVQVYLDEVWGLVTREEIARKQKIFMVESRFNLAWLHKDIFGTNDCSVYDVRAHKLRVLDYKHGKGVVVSPEWNTQLLTYALGAMHTIWDSQTAVTKKVISVFNMFDEVELVIVQPRAGEEPIRRWTTTAREIMAWGFNVLRAGALKTEEPQAPLKAGSHCRFCKAIAVCPEQARHACAIAKVDFAKPLLPSPEELTPDDIAKILEVSKSFNNWAGQVKAYAQGQMERGVVIPGYKLVNRKANRAWKKGVDIESQLVLLLGEENAYVRKPLSVAQAEKKCAGEGIEKKALEDFWEKPDKGVTIADESDKRKALVSSVVDDFDDMGFLN